MTLLGLNSSWRRQTLQVLILCLVVLYLSCTWQSLGQLLRFIQDVGLITEKGVVQCRRSFTLVHVLLQYLQLGAVTVKLAQRCQSSKLGNLVLHCFLQLIIKKVPYCAKITYKCFLTIICVSIQSVNSNPNFFFCSISQKVKNKALCEVTKTTDVSPALVSTPTASCQLLAPPPEVKPLHWSLG